MTLHTFILPEPEDLLKDLLPGTKTSLERQLFGTILRPMPEGPEVHREAKRIAQNLQSPSEVTLICDYPELKKEFSNGNLRLKKVQAFGKAIVMSFEGGRCIYSHNQLYGKWHFSDDRNSLAFKSRSRRLRLESSKGWAELYSATDLFWVDQNDVSKLAYIRKLGPDALNPETSFEEVLRHIQKPCFQRKRLHTLLLDQSFVAGLGNYLRSEILFRSAQYSKQTTQTGDCTYVPNAKSFRQASTESFLSKN